MYTCIAGESRYCSFVVTRENQSAMKSVLDFSYDGGIQLLCVYGEEGTGKTHLSWIARDMLNEEGFMARVLTEYNLMEAVTRWLDQGKDIRDFYQEYEMWDGLILENIHKFEEEKFQDALHNLMNQFWIRGKKFMVTCNRHPDELEWFGEQQIFEKVGLVKPSTELKKMVLGDYEHMIKVELSEEIKDLIVRHTEKIPDIQNVLNKVMFYHKNRGKDLTLGLVASILKCQKGEQNK